nr:flagellar filament capping protein FliD [Legionella sp. PL877]
MDIKAIVESLVQADLSPAQRRLDKQEASFITQLSALGQIKSSLAKLQTSLTKLSDLAQFYTLKSSISDDSVFSTTINENNAAAGNYQIEVQQLATRQNLASIAFSNSSDTIGSGSITIDFGAYSADNSTFTLNPDKESVTINIVSGSDNLLAIKDAINRSGAGIQANIVQDSQGARLTLTSPETGEDLAMRISVVDDDGINNDASGLSVLAYDPTVGTMSLTQTVAAQNSEVKINGLLLTQNSNQLKDAIAGVTINLKKAQPGSLVDLKIENDKTKLTGLVNDFIKQYNDTMATINALSGYDPVAKKGGLLQSDAGVRALKLNLSKLIGEPLTGTNNPFRTLTDIGIKTNENGQLVMDEKKFNTALESNYDAIGVLFAKTATTTDSNVHIKTVGSQVKAGSYDLILDSFTPGSILSGTIGGVHATSTDGITLSGTGTFRGLSVEILAGSTGNRGQIQVSDGLATKFNNLLTNYLDEKSGDFATRANQLNKRLETIGDAREQLTFRASMLAKRYTRQFVGLDALLVQMQSASDFLSQQLANLPKLNNRG